MEGASSGRIPRLRTQSSHYNLIMEREVSPTSDWLGTAQRFFPELVEENQEWVDSMYLLWIMLRLAFEEAYKSNPRNNDRIARTYRFAKWCLTQPRGLSAEDDWLTCVCVCFYEHIPEFEPSFNDITNWISSSDFDDLKDTFKYHISTEKFAELETKFHP